MNTKVILKRIALRITELDENGNYYFADYKTKGKIIFYPLSQTEETEFAFM